MLIDVIATPVISNGHSYLKIKIPIVVGHILPSHQAKVKRVNALWDTGATNTSIPMHTAELLGIPLREETATQQATSEGSARFCTFHLFFPDGRIVRIDDGNAVPGLRTGLIIGMDLISRGTSTITPLSNGAVRLTFEFTSA